MTYDMSWGSQLHLIGLVAVATLLGGVIGFDREAADKPAGLRTHMLVAGAAATIAAAGRTIFLDAGGGMGDPNRPLQAVVMGIGFLGAGTILRLPSERRIEGLTTAATLFFAAAIGVTVGFDLLPFALGAALVVLVVARGIGAIEKRMDRRD